MYVRVPSDDVGMLVSAIGIQFRVGGNLANVVRTLSETVRDRQKIRGDIKTLTAQQKYDWMADHARSLWSWLSRSW